MILTILTLNNKNVLWYWLFWPYSTNMFVDVTSVPGMEFLPPYISNVAVGKTHIVVLRCKVRSESTPAFQVQLTPFYKMTLHVMVSNSFWLIVTVRSSFINLRKKSNKIIFRNNSICQLRLACYVKAYELYEIISDFYLSRPKKFP